MTVAMERLHPWVERFAATEPDHRIEMLDSVLRDIADVPPYSRALPRDTLVTMFGGLPETDPVLIGLDRAMAAWLDERRCWGAKERRDYGLQHFVTDMDQALRTVVALSLSNARGWVCRNFLDLMHWATPISYDPTSRLDVSIAGTRAAIQVNNAAVLSTGGLRHYWLRVAERAAGSDGRPLLNAALLGLSRLPDRPAGQVPRDVITGLVRWARRLNEIPKDQAAFIQKWHATRARYPVGPSTWSNLWQDVVVVDHDREPEPIYLDWVKALDPKIFERRRRQTVSFEAPSRQELEHVVRDVLAKGDAELGRFRNFMMRYEDYARGTGDPFLLLVATSFAGGRLIEKYPEEVLALARRLLAWAPNDQHAWSLRARALIRLGRPDLAEAVFWEAVRRLPDNPALRVDLANLRAAAGAETEAERLLRDAHDANPDHEPSAVELARLLARTGYDAEAERILRDVHHAKPDAEYSAVELARLLARTGRIGEGENILRTFVKERLQYPIVLYTLAEFLIAQSKPAQEMRDTYVQRFGNDHRSQTLDRLLKNGDLGIREIRQHLDRAPHPSTPAEVVSHKKQVSVPDTALAAEFQVIAASVQAELMLRSDDATVREQATRALQGALATNDDNLLAHVAYALHDDAYQTELAKRRGDFPNSLALDVALVGASTRSDWGERRRAHHTEIPLIDLAELISGGGAAEASRNRLEELSRSEAQIESPAARRIRSAIRTTGLSDSVLTERAADLRGVLATGAMSVVPVTDAIVSYEAA